MPSDSLPGPGCLRPSGTRDPKSGTPPRLIAAPRGRLLHCREYDGFEYGGLQTVVAVALSAMACNGFRVVRYCER